MKIKMFNKIITVDEKNPGIDFFLNECCEFPTEAFMKVAYGHKNLECSDNNALKKIEDLSVSELLEVLKFGILETFEIEERMSGRSYQEVKEHVENAFQ